MVNYRYLGYGITDNNGIAHLDHDANGNPITHSYTGTGAGELDIIASLDDSTKISDSSIQSEIYDVWDCIKYDTGIEGTATNIYSNTSPDALTRTNEYTRLKEVTTGTDVRTEIINLPVNFNMDFDFNQIDGSNGNGIMNLYDKNNNYLTYFSLSLISENSGNWLKLRLAVTENSATLTNLDNPSHTVTQTFTGTVSKLRIITGSGITELRWKNVKIYL